jgi:hypothetical protein
MLPNGYSYGFAPLRRIPGLQCRHKHHMCGIFFSSPGFQGLSEWFLGAIEMIFRIFVAARVTIIPLRIGLESFDDELGDFWKVVEGRKAYFKAVRHDVLCWVNCGVAEAETQARQTQGCGPKKLHWRWVFILSGLSLKFDNMLSIVGLRERVELFVM